MDDDDPMEGAVVVPAMQTIDVEMSSLVAEISEMVDQEQQQQQPSMMTTTTTTPLQQKSIVVAPSQVQRINVVSKQIAIAPKPLGTTATTGTALGAVKKISLADLKSKSPTVIDGSGRRVVVIPSSGNKYKLVQASPTGGGTSQIVRTMSGRTIQLKPGAIPIPPLTKLTNTTESPKSAVIQKPKFISLQQAQQMGLVTSGKINQSVTLSAMKPITTNVITTKPIVRPAISTIKSPAKILPAPPKGLNTNLILTTLPLQSTQNVVVKSPPPQVAKSPQFLKVDNVTGTGNTILASLQPGQKINPQQIHQINVPGKGVQFVRLVATTRPNQTQKSGLPSPVRIAPMTTATKTLPTSAKIVPAKPRVLAKSFVLDVQGKLLQVPATIDAQSISSTSGSSSGSINSGEMQKVIGTITSTGVITSPSKFVPVTLNLNSFQQKITPMITSNINISQLKKCKDERSEIDDASEVKISKTEVIEEDEEALNNNESMEDQMSTDEAMEVKNALKSAQSADMKHIVMVPASYIQQIQGKNLNSKSISIASNVEIKQEIDNNNKNNDCSLELGMRLRKPCNCTKSQCLKLYCDCFANGEFCNNCNCNNCYNNLSNEEFRQKAIRTCLERNPNAFRPKIGKAKNYGLEVIRRHNKGCNCKRSGCLKNYCECYEGKIACSANCKCVGCRNIEDSLDKRSMRKARTEVILGSLTSKRDDLDHTSESLVDIPMKSETNYRKDNTKMRKPWGYMTTDVIEAVCNCLVAQASESEAFEGPDSSNATRYILEEFARCLQDMISTAQIFPVTDDVHRLPT